MDTTPIVETKAVIEQRIRAEHPEVLESSFGRGSREPQTTAIRGEAREAWVAEQVTAEQDRQRAVLLDYEQRQQLRTLVEALEAGTATNRQVQSTLARLVRRELNELREAQVERRT